MIKDAIDALADADGIDVDVHPGKGEHFEVSSADEGAMIAFLLKRQRQMHGLSLADVSARLGRKSRNAYARYEQGKAVPTIAKLSELLKAVNPDGELVLKTG